MKAKYFKKHYSNKELLTVIKVTEEGTLSIHDGNINIFSLKGDYYAENGYEKSTEEEFNSFYSMVQEKINNLLNL